MPTQFRPNRRQFGVNTLALGLMSSISTASPWGAEPTRGGTPDANTANRKLSKPAPYLVLALDTPESQTAARHI